MLINVDIALSAIVVSRRHSVALLLQVGQKELGLIPVSGWGILTVRVPEYV